MLTQRQREIFEEDLELDFAYSVPGRARFRVNVYRQREHARRGLPADPVRDQAPRGPRRPAAVEHFAGLPRGLVLVTGPTGSGKSTTLAVARSTWPTAPGSDHIMTVEDPIEFLHQHKSCMVNQREVGEDTHVLRQRAQARAAPGPRHHPGRRDARPGDDLGRAHRGRDRPPGLRHPAHAGRRADRSTASSTSSPPHQQQQVRTQLAGALQGVVCQTLCQDVGRQAAGPSRPRSWWPRPAIRNLIREGKTHQIYSAMQAGAQHGMHTLDQHLAELVRGRPDQLRARSREVPPRRGLQPPLPAAAEEAGRHEHGDQDLTHTRSGTARASSSSGKLEAASRGGRRRRSCGHGLRAR